MQAISGQRLEDFLKLLKGSPSGAVFNPWWQVDKQNDVNRNAPAIRMRQLSAYLRERRGKAKLAIIGEALGYRGGHFTGIPMTSERLLLAGEILCGIEPRRTSKPEKCSRGFSEPTATIVWKSLLQSGLAPNEFVLWNAFPWHSYDPSRGMLSNRTPTKNEGAAGRAVLKTFLKLFTCRQIVALGKIAAAQLEEIGVDAQCVRHPASGGARVFRQQIGEIVANLS
jgi:uracil-DNA glycosylase